MATPTVHEFHCPLCGQICTVGIVTHEVKQVATSDKGKVLFQVIVRTEPVNVAHTCPDPSQDRPRGK